MTKPDDCIITVPDIGDEPKQGLGEVLFEKIRAHGDSAAQILADTGEERSYSRLLQSSVRTAIKLKETGVSVGDIVGMVSTNILDSYVPFLASQFIGAIFISWDSVETEGSLAESLKQVPLKVIFVSQELVQKIEKALKIAETEVKIVVLGESDVHTRFSEFLERVPNEENFKPTSVQNVRSTAIILFSSGSTGKPKGTCLNHYSLLAQIKYLQYIEDLDQGLLEKESAMVSFPIKILNVVPLYWISSYLVVINIFYSGTLMVVWQNYDTSKLLHMIQKFKVRIAGISPPQVIELLKLGRPKDLELTHPIGFSVAGNMISAQHIQDLRKMLPEADVYQSYGLTEVTGLVTRFHSLDKRHRKFFAAKPGSCGLPVPGTSYKVVDPETEKILGPNQHGELRLKSTLIMNGFYNQDSSDVFDSDGWFKTGDFVYYDEDKCFYVVGRLKTTFKFRIYHVYPSVIETELIDHPAVKQAVVIPKPDDMDSFHPVAIVVLEKDKKATEEELLQYANSKLNFQHQLRGGIKIVDNIPLTGTGKVKRRELIDMVTRSIL